MLGMNSKGTSLYLIDRKEKSLEEIEVKLKIAQSLKTKAVTVNDNGKLVLIHDFTGNSISAFSKPNSIRQRSTVWHILPKRL